MVALKSCGQATVEYIFILAFAVMLGFQFTNRFTEFFGDTLGGVGHVLSTHLTIGVCEKDCWFNGYKNSYGAAP
ncbi:hypothetical protein ACJVC5_06305 [Peredibacter sp. HCB2-198]|uniref:hypothetical protein n=1 Tax=Peredibacter sp. HCB2-198 TaxID=3383025 RepID=UPI0038B443B6